MIDSAGAIATVYLYAASPLVSEWLRFGITSTDALSGRLPLNGYVQAWLTTELDTVRPDFDWLVAAVPAESVWVADHDLRLAAELGTAESKALAYGYEQSLTPLTLYRLGRFRRPEALVAGFIAADWLAPLPASDPIPYHGAEYARQLYQALRAMIGAPSDAPLEALVAAAVARGRARRLLAYPTQPPLLLYSVDQGAWYFTLDPAFSQVSASQTLT